MNQAPPIDSPTVAKTLPPIHRWDEVAAPRGCVHITHGMAEHGKRYAQLAGDLNRAGYVVWAHDHRGHGENTDPAVGCGHFADSDGWRALIDDTWAVSREMRATYPTLPLFLFGHSMGSFVAQTLTAQRGTEYDGVVVAGSNGPQWLLGRTGSVAARLERMVRGGRAPARMIDGIVFGGYNRQFKPRRTKLDWLSRNEDEVDKYIDDPLCGFPLTTQSWVDFLDGLLVLGSKEHFAKIPKTLPIFVIGGSRDPVGRNSRGLQRLLREYERNGLQKVSCRFYPDARHELVNETNRDEVIRDLIDWFDKQRLEVRG